MTWKSESNKQTAEIGKCLECGQELQRGPLYAWTLRKTFWHHEYGTGHKRFEVIAHSSPRNSQESPQYLRASNRDAAQRPRRSQSLPERIQSNA
jgi:hypothetical protein